MRLHGVQAKLGVTHASLAHKHFDHRRIGAICFYLIDRFVRDGRLGNLLKILVALISRLLPTLGVSF
jgi:hypothetical protein